MNIEVLSQLCEMYLYTRNQNRAFGYKLSYFPMKSNLSWIGDECDSCHNDTQPCNDGEGCDYIKCWDMSPAQLRETLATFYIDFDSTEFTEFLNNEGPTYPALEKELQRLSSLKAFW